MSATTPAHAFTGVASDALRRQNLSAILRRVHAHGPASRSTLATQTGLNRSTVAALVGELVDLGLIEEGVPVATGLPGRPSPIVAVRPRGAVVLAVEVSVDSLAVALVGLGGTVLARRRVAQPRDGRTVDTAVATIQRAAAELRATPEGQEIYAIGVAVAGVVRRSDGFVALAPNLEWRDVPLGQRLWIALGMAAPIVVGNDADLVTLAEYTRGAGAGTRDFVCLWGEAGVGAGIVSEARPLRGHGGLAGEVGHLPVRPGGRRCHCGARGCWETEIGEEAMLRAVGRPGAAGGPATLDAVIADAERGDPTTLAALREIGRWLGLGLAGLVNVLDPERIALGGMFGRLHPYVSAAITEELSARRMTPSRVRVDVMPALLGADAPLIGAAELALAPLLDDPSVAPPRGVSAAGPDPVKRKEVGSTVNV